jgi:hypothetical protein
MSSDPTKVVRGAVLAPFLQHLPVVGDLVLAFLGLG